MSGVLLRETSSNRKLAHVDVIDKGYEKPALVPRAPFVSSTYVAIGPTCPDTCKFKGAGCYAASGFTGMVAARLDRAAEGLTGDDVIAAEVLAIDHAFGGGRVPQDGARGGRDLRLHVGGDASSEAGARGLAGAAERWRARGGGSVWTYTHLWRVIPRDAWGSISVLASVEHVSEIAEANARGYVAALVVARFHSRKRSGGVVPCPAETRTKASGAPSGVTCASCRLCLDRDLSKLGITIGFSTHGPDAPTARSSLVQLRLF